MVRKSTLREPDGLQDAGAKLWADVAGKYVLRADELSTLEAACRAADRVRQMEIERDGAVTASGSMGQLIVHPLIPEIRAHEAQVSSLLAKLKLPDEAGEGQVSQQRAAAQSRWASAHGAAS
jgi:hypothetical protein